MKIGRFFWMVLSSMFLLSVFSGCTQGSSDIIKQNDENVNSDSSSTNGKPDSVSPSDEISATIKMEPENALLNLDPSSKFQQIEGFGFFGGRDVWWSSGDAGHFYSDEWLELVLDDLGLTMWRNELYPNNPVESNNSTEKQDADWDKQKPLAKALAQKAKELSVPLKTILTVWSPPGEWKIQCQMQWAGDEKAERGGAHNSTKNGGTLDPEKYAQFADWLADGIKMYEKEGIEVYALSLQNEPAFKQSFNSCTYTTKWYCELLKNVVPKVKKKYPKVKIFGSENMLKNEGAEEDYRWFYHAAIFNDKEALKNLDVFAVHGYSDGVLAEAVENHKDFWTRTRLQFSEPSGKPYWMTETSGYVDDWHAKGGKPGARDLAIAIYSALYHGRASAWVWWQGSELNGIGEYNLMNGTKTGKKYYVSKHFYRFIRPESYMIDVKSNEDSLFACAFKNDKLQNFVIVLINTDSKPKKLEFTGEGVPDKFDCYVTDSSKDMNCRLMGTFNASDIIIPQDSIVTLINGRFKEKE